MHSRIPQQTCVAYHRGNENAMLINNRQESLTLNVERLGGETVYQSTALLLS